MRLVKGVPVGTNLGLIQVFWMMLSGRLLGARGAVIPGLDALGLPEDAVRRAWMAFAKGAWETHDLVEDWSGIVEQEGEWQPHHHGAYHPVAVDVTHFLRPRLANCPTKHYPAKTGHTVPAIPIGLIARVGQVGSQRLGIPVKMVRAPSDDPRREVHARELVRQAVCVLKLDEVAVFDRGFVVSLLQSEGCERFVVRLLKNFTARRSAPPDYKGRGRRPKHGETVRPLDRERNGRFYPATPPDDVERWTRDGVELYANRWDDLVLPDSKPGAPTFRVFAIHDPRYEGPLLLATSLAVTAAQAQAIYLDRWPVEQLPLAAKQMIGAHRQFVHAPETCQRLPELSLLAGSVLSYVAATQSAVPTGFWDRKPQPTPGRLRRVLARVDFPERLVPAGRIRRKASATNHLPKGHWGQQRRHTRQPLTIPAPT